MTRVVLICVGLFCSGCDPLVAEEDPQQTRTVAADVAMSEETFLEIRSSQAVYSIGASTFQELPQFRDPRWPRRNSGIRLRALLAKLSISSSRLLVHSRQAAPLSLDVSSDDIFLLKKNRNGKLRFRVLRPKGNALVEVHSQHDVVQLVLEPPPHRYAGD